LPEPTLLSTKAAQTGGRKETIAVCPQTWGAPIPFLGLGFRAGNLGGPGGGGNRKQGGAFRLRGAQGVQSCLAVTRKVPLWGVWSTQKKKGPAAQRGGGGHPPRGWGVPGGGPPPSQASSGAAGLSFSSVGAVRGGAGFLGGLGDEGGGREVRRKFLPPLCPFRPQGGGGGGGRRGTSWERTNKFSGGASQKGGPGGGPGAKNGLRFSEGKPKGARENREGGI